MEELKFPSDNRENEGCKNTEKPPKRNSKDDLAEVRQKTRRDQWPRSCVSPVLHGHTLTWRSPAQRGPLCPPLISVTAPALANGASAGVTDRGSKCAARLGFCLHPGRHPGRSCPPTWAQGRQMHPSPHTPAGRRKA